MRKMLLVLLAVVSTSFSLPFPKFLKEKEVANLNKNVMGEIVPIITPGYATPLTIISPFDEIKDMLYRDGSLNEAVIHKVLSSIKCADGKNIEHNNVLTVIDYSLPSSEKRLWVFDLHQKKLLFHTYVSHGIKSGTLLTNFFSNKNNSKASSMGVYTTEKTYYGRDGLSLRLDGLESGFNDNASNRSVVMHGSWYVQEDFIKKYGRAGRSWGCPAVPLDMTASIINTIKNKSLLVVYYPSDTWFAKSKFLNCEDLSPHQAVMASKTDGKSLGADNESREEVLFADINRNHKSEESAAILVMAADGYERFFHTKPPLERMLRRQINQTEYIALSTNEFKTIAANNGFTPDETASVSFIQGLERTSGAVHNGLNEVSFVIPTLKMVRGYYRTEMKIINLGKIKNVTLDLNRYTVHFEENSMINLRVANQFIRWLGL